MCTCTWREAFCVAEMKLTSCRKTKDTTRVHGMAYSQPSGCRKSPPPLPLSLSHQLHMKPSLISAPSLTLGRSSIVVSSYRILGTRCMTKAHMGSSTLDDVNVLDCTRSHGCVALARNGSTVAHANTCKTATVVSKHGKRAHIHSIQ